MYMIEITEDKLHKMSEHVESGLRHLGKLMQCLEELEEEDYTGAYGEKGRLGMRSHEDWDEEEYPKREKFGKRMRRY